MINFGDKLKLKFDIYDEYITKIVGYREDYVKVLEIKKTNPDCRTRIKVLGNNDNIFEVKCNEVMEIFKIPDFYKTIPIQSGWYLYKLNIDDTPTYCKLELIDEVLTLYEGIKNTPVKDLMEYYWLRVG
jgi:hypothetical protein